jgi:hypothetical protein
MSQTIQIAPMALLEAKLVQKLEEKKREGWKINPSVEYDMTLRECCLIGAQLDDDPTSDSLVLVAKRLSITPMQADELENGFMGLVLLGDVSDPFHQLGAKLRAQYVETK